MSDFTDGKGYSSCAWKGCKNKKQGRSRWCPTHHAVVQGNTHHKTRDIRTLSEDEVNQIKRRMKAFENPLKLAKEFNVTKSTILNVMKR